MKITITAEVEDVETILATAESVKTGFDGPNISTARLHEEAFDSVPREAAFMASSLCEHVAAVRSSGARQAPGDERLPDAVARFLDALCGERFADPAEALDVVTLKLGTMSPSDPILGRLSHAVYRFYNPVEKRR